jgi:hypothetical protein
MWKDIEGYEGLYKVSKFGRIFSFYDNRILNPKPRKSKYLIIGLYKDGVRITYRVHRLVAEAFIPNPLNKATVNHRDGNKSNNNVWNLEWATHKENTKHAWDNDLMSAHGNIGIQNGMCILTPIQVLEIREKWAYGNYAQKQLCDEYGISRGGLYGIITRRTWKHI